MNTLSFSAASSSTCSFPGSSTSPAAGRHDQNLRRPTRLLSVALNPERRRRSRAVATAHKQNRTFCGLSGRTSSAGAPTSVPVRVAHELLLAGHRYLDVRTTEEFAAGHVPGAINIPYMFKVGSGMTKNPNFVKEVSAQFGKYDEIIIGCQLGKRSLMAATELTAAGFSAVTDIAGGYAAWTHNGLPREE